jgi:hypothetical protein
MRFLYPQIQSRMIEARSSGAYKSIQFRVSVTLRIEMVDGAETQLNFYQSSSEGLPISSFLLSQDDPGFLCLL